MALEGSLANIIINDNTINKGITSSGTYNYTSNGWVTGSAIIKGNTFASSSNGIDMFNVDDGSCIIAHNKFIRDTSSINSYIRNFGSSDQIITDNIFDGYTVDGSNFDLVTGLTSTSTYERNKNQTVYKQIKIAQHFGSPRTFTTLAINGPYAVSFAESAYEVFSVQTDSGGGSVTTPIRASFNLDQYLPKGVRILNVMFSFTGLGYFELGVSTSTFFMQLTRTENNNVSFTSPTSGLADVASKWFGTYGLQSGSSNTIRSNTLTATGTSNTYRDNTGYLIINLPDNSTNNYITQTNISNNIYMSLDVQQSRSTFSANFFSGFFVRYKYI